MVPPKVITWPFRSYIDFSRSKFTRHIIINGYVIMVMLEFSFEMGKKTPLGVPFILLLTCFVTNTLVLKYGKMQKNWVFLDHSICIFIENSKSSYIYIYILIQMPIYWWQSACFQILGFITFLVRIMLLHIKLITVLTYYWRETKIGIYEKVNVSPIFLGRNQLRNIYWNKSCTKSCNKI